MKSTETEQKLYRIKNSKGEYLTSDFTFGNEADALNFTTAYECHEWYQDMIEHEIDLLKKRIGEEMEMVVVGPWYRLQI